MEKVSKIREDVLFLNQLIKTLEESEEKLEKYYREKDHKNFNNIKKFMLSILEKISEIIK